MNQRQDILPISRFGGELRQPGHHGAAFFDGVARRFSATHWRSTSRCSKLKAQKNSRKTDKLLNKALVYCV